MLDRHWFLTSTTYGSWLPGDARGFVSGVRNLRRMREIHNVPGTDYDSDMPKLKDYARRIARGNPILLTLAHARLLLVQFHETARHRRWGLRAVAILRTHVHLIVGVTCDSDPDRVLGDFKAYGSRALNRVWGKPATGTWWTEKGSTRKLRCESASLSATEYIRNQPNPLLIWIAGENPAPVP